MRKKVPPLLLRLLISLTICAYFLVLPAEMSVTSASESLEADIFQSIEDQVAAEAAEQAEQEAAEAAEQAAQEAAEQAAEQATEQATQEAAEQASSEAAEQAAQEAAEQAAEQATEQATQEAAEQASSEAAEQAAQEAAEQAAEQATEQATQEAAEQASSEAAEQASSEAAEQAAQEAAEQAAEQETQEAAEQASSEAAEQAAQEAAEQAEQETQEAAEQASSEAAEQAAQEAAEQAEQETQEAAEQAEQETQEAAEQAEQETQEAAEQAEQETQEAAEQDEQEVEVEEAEELKKSENEDEQSSGKREDESNDKLTYIANLNAERLRIIDENWYEHEIEAVSKEILVLSDDKDQFNIEKSNYQIQEQIYLEGLDLVLTRIKTPEETSTSISLGDLSTTLEKGEVDLNHIYDLESQGLQEKDAIFDTADFSKVIALNGVQHTNIKLGLIDTQINQSHSALINQNIIMKDLVPYEGVRPENHGTSVASIMVGHERSVFKGIIPKAELYVASIFFTMATGEVAATTESLILALDWLVQQDVPIINMSLSGPENKLLEIAIKRVMEKGILIVAAVGNAGPNAKPLYPAAYNGVVAVTAVDKKHQAYLRANRGDYVTFAALGVDIITAKASGGYHQQTGTSIAAPFVSAILTNISSTEKMHIYLQKLKKNTIDLGPPGFDDIYGYGLIQAISE